MVKKSSLSKINDLIFREVIKRGYSLEGKTRVWNIADSKLWYLTSEQAQSYLDLLDSEDYKTEFGPKEMILIKKELNEILSRVGPNSLNLIDLGCGDGRKAVVFLDEILKRKIAVRYCPIDISGYMVQKAIEKMSHLNVHEIITSQWNISDFENLYNIVPLLNQGVFKKNLFLLLGNTLGNFEINELLYSVRNAMKSGDFLLIGNGLDNAKVEEDVVKFCKENKLNNEFLIKIPLQIGLSREDIRLDVRFVNSRVEFYYILEDDKTVEFQGRKISFFKGDQIIVAVAYHYKKEEFMSFLKMYFGDVELFVSKDGSYTLALCKK